MVAATCTKACVWLLQRRQRGVHVATATQFRLNRYGQLWAKYTNRDNGVPRTEPKPGPVRVRGRYGYGYGAGWRGWGEGLAGDWREAAGDWGEGHFFCG